MTTRALRWFAWALTGVYWIALFIVTHLPPHDLPRVRVSDKAVHFWVYFFLAVGVYVSLWLTRRSALWCAILVVSSLWIYGAIDELLQIPVGRIADVRDWYADATGVVAATILMMIAHYILEKVHRGMGSSADR